jgi:hypothetical protein
MDEAQAQAQRDQFAGEFTKGYYHTFDTNRQGLANLYRPHSTLTFEGEIHRGHEAIVKKLVALPFTRIEHEIGTTDTQETAAGIIILVTGRLLVDDEKRPMSYCQTFSISHDGQYFVYNDVFRLVYG